MSGNKTIQIKDRLYDAVTGLPVSPEPMGKEEVTESTIKHREATPAAAVHAAPQRSRTLHRHSIKKSGIVTKRPQTGRHMDITRSPSVKRFATHPVTQPASTVNASTTPDKPAVTHPVARQAVAKVMTVPTPPLTPREVKEAAIEKALATPKAKKASKTKKGFHWTRKATIVTALLVLLMGAVLVTYLNLPTLSVAFAASRAGIDASYPKYVPDGYGLKQPVTYREGEVTVTFASRGGAGDYTITQSRSDWDSSAVLENVVRKNAGDNYIINQEGGLTIYTFNSNSGAAWVNGGILYTITSDAPLSTNQMRRIATSL